MKLEKIKENDVLTEHISETLGKNQNLDRKVKVTNFQNGRQTYDTLHGQSTRAICQSTHCAGSLMSGPSPDTDPRTARSKDIVKVEAEKFLEEYFLSTKNGLSDDAHVRLGNVVEEIQEGGTWIPTKEELLFGAKLAWRNAPRCIGRIQWTKLELNDARHVTTTAEMYQALVKHLSRSTNGGNIRSLITVFPAQIEGREDFRVWNPQLLSYAGYLEADGSITGDPSKVQFTRVCQRLGWKGKGGMFDILPWVLSTPTESAKYYDVPEDLVLRVPLEHPTFSWFREMNLEWYAVPAVADMMLDMGGIHFTACPFNGWYMGTEIGARDLCDPQRYNIINDVAARMGLDTSSPLSLWKDKALVEVNVAVLYSYQKRQVTLVDHHTASEQFMKHLETEKNSRGGCPADWVWIVPPVSGSLTPVFHQEMLNYLLKPSFEYQEKAWKTYKWTVPSTCKRKYRFSSIVKATVWVSSLMNLVRKKRTRCTVLFATETGRSETYALRLSKLMNNAFNSRVLCMSDYNMAELEQENILLLIASTFGSGEAPDNGKDFWKNLQKVQLSNQACLGETMFAVFALGSTQYPSFCAFGKALDGTMEALGGRRLLGVGLGDELRGQEQTFHHWAEELYRVTCASLRLNINISASIASFEEGDTWNTENIRVISAPEETTNDTCSQLSRIHHKKVYPCKVLSRARLQARHSDRQTILVRLNTHRAKELNYEPGDHLGIFPCNSPKVVEQILDHLRLQGYQGETLDVQTQSGGFWSPVQRLPPCTLRTALTRYLDISTPPTARVLNLLSDMTSQNWDKYRLKRLAKVIDEYEEWRSYRYPNLAEVLEDFPSVQLTPAFILLQIPLLQPRYYSISSSMLVTPGEVHLTMSIVSYSTQGGKGPVHQGVCTSYLNGFPEDEVFCFVRLAPSFHMVKDPSVPIIMIGSGSGIAPFRSFWQQREMEMKKANCLQTAQDVVEFSLEKDRNEENPGGSEFGPLILLFGCRQPNVDNIYNHETSPLLRKGVLQKVVTAFSRQFAHKKVYVQDSILNEQKMVYDLLVRRYGHVYVCGDAVMADGVRAAVKLVIERQSGALRNEAETIFQKILNEGRYHEDVFGVLHRRETREMSWQSQLVSEQENVTVSVMTRRKSTPSMNSAKVAVKGRKASVVVYRPIP